MDIFQYILLPLLIFFARIVDVSLGTIRIIFISKGFKFLSLIIGFVEVLIWLVAINRIWSDMSNVWLYIAYAGGFATGNYVGIWLDEKISLGMAMITVIIRKNANKLIRALKKSEFKLTIVNGQSGKAEKDVKIIFLVVKRRDIKKIFNVIQKINPKAFYTIEDIRSVRKNEYVLIERKHSSSGRLR